MLVVALVYSTCSHMGYLQPTCQSGMVTLTTGAHWATEPGYAIAPPRSTVKLHTPYYPLCPSQASVTPNYIECPLPHPPLGPVTLYLVDPRRQHRHPPFPACHQVLRQMDYYLNNVTKLNLFVMYVGHWLVEGHASRARGGANKKFRPTGVSPTLVGSMLASQQG